MMMAFDAKVNIHFLSVDRLESLACSFDFYFSLQSCESNVGGKAALSQKTIRYLID